MAADTVVSPILGDGPVQSVSVVESGAGGRGQQTASSDISRGQQEQDTEMQQDSSGDRRTRYGVGYEFRTKRVERVERPHRPERVQRPMRPSRPGR